MKKAILVLAILLATTTVTFAQMKMDTTHKHMKKGTKKYTCPMHPEVVKTKPGKCPKCGMALVPMKMKVGKKEKPMKGMKM